MAKRSNLRQLNPFTSEVLEPVLAIGSRRANSPLGTSILKGCGSKSPDIREQSNPTVKERIVCKRGPYTEVQIKYAPRLKFGQSGPSKHPRITSASWATAVSELGPQATWRTLFLQSPRCAQDSEAVERASNSPRHLDHMCVDHRRLQAAVTEQQLYRPDVGT